MSPLPIEQAIAKANHGQNLVDWDMPKLKTAAMAAEAAMAIHVSLSHPMGANT